MKAKNVILTSPRLCAVGWFTNILSEIHKRIYGDPIKWRYEISRFECTRERRPLPLGYNTVWDANPKVLADRKFDKVLVLVRDIVDILNAACWYNKFKSFIDVIRDKDYRFVDVIVKNYDKLYSVTYKDDKILYIYLKKLNQAPEKGFKEICEFLGFDMKKMPIIIPIKVERDWEIYGGYNKGLELDEQLKKMKNWIKGKMDEEEEMTEFYTKRFKNVSG